MNTTMRAIGRRVAAICVAAVMAVLLIPASALEARAAGTTPITMDLTFGQTEARSMLELINKFRLGTDENPGTQPEHNRPGYLNKDNTTWTDLSGTLSALTYDYELERTAMQRAAEAAIYWGHKRPDGTDCYAAWPDGQWWAKGENLAAGNATALSTFLQWREDEDDYDGQGHRRNMLASSFEKIGIGHVVCGGIHFWAHAFGKGSSESTYTEPVDGAIQVSMTLLNDSISNMTTAINPTAISLGRNQETDIPVVSKSFRYDGSWPKNKTIVATTTPVWTSGNSGIAKVENGKVVGIDAGTTTLTATLDGQSLTVPVTVMGIQSVANPGPITVTSGTDPAGQLPAQLIATWTDGSQTLVAVEWQDVGDFASIWKAFEGGMFYIQGTVSGYSGTVSQQVIVNPAVAIGATIEPDTETVNSGMAPAARPDTASVRWSNGDTTEEDITWSSEITKEDYTNRTGEAKTVTYIGQVEGREVTFTLTVNSASITALTNPDDLEIFSSTTNVTSLLPTTVTATWSDGEPTTEENVTWEDAQDSYEPGTYMVSGSVIGTDLTATQTIRVTAPTLQSITWKSQPTKKEYVVGQTLDTSDGVIIANYNNNSSQEVPVTPAMVSGFDSSTPVEDQTLTVTYADGDVSKSLDYTIQVIERKVQTGSFDFSDVKKEYIEGQEIDPTGGKLTITYNDGTNEDVELTADMLHGYNKDQIGNQSIMAIYTVSDDRAFSDTFSVNVRAKQITAIRVLDGAKTDYIEKQDLDLSTFKICADYDNGTTSDEIQVTEVMVSGYDKTKVGEQTVTITYGGKSTTVTVNVRKKTALNLEVTPPTETWVYEKTEMDLTGGRVKLTYDNGDVETKDLTADMVSGYDQSEDVEEDKVIWITVSADGLTRSEAFSLTVRAVTVDSITIKQEPTKTEYIIRETYDVSGAIITAHYSNGDSADINVTEAMSSVPDLGEVNDRIPVTITFDGKTVEFYVKVRDRAPVSIAVSTMPTKTTYLEGDPFEAAGGKITITYDNAETEAEDLTEEMCTVDMTKTGEQTVSVSYEGKTTSFSIVIEPKTPESVEWSEEPTEEESTVEEGAPFPFAGKAKISYNNGTEDIVDVTEANFTVSGYDKDKPGVQEVKLILNDNEECMLATTVTVIEKQTGWKDTDKGRVYILNKAGDLAKGWTMIGENRYYFDLQSGIMQTKWIKDGNDWYYLSDPDGRMYVGEWQSDSGGMCYLKSGSGKAAKSEWIKHNGDWYYIDANNHMVKNTWQKDSAGWCYLGKDGKMLTNDWAKDSKGWCYLDANGRITKNRWVTWKGDWYYLKADGYMAANEWVKDSGGWCYLESSGRAVKNKWIYWKGYWYYLKSDLHMAASEYVQDSKGRCWVDSSGRWDGKYR